MDIKFIRGTFHLGYAHRAGDSASYPDKVANMFIEGGYAQGAGLQRRPERKEVEPEVHTTVVTRSRKRPIKK